MPRSILASPIKSGTHTVRVTFPEIGTRQRGTEVLQQTSASPEFAAGSVGNLTGLACQLESLHLQVLVSFQLVQLQ